jgi:predicted SAM-dependent methyltransferase
MIRSRCVICNNKALEDIYLDKNASISIGSSIDPIESDIHKDLQYVICSSCGCVQLSTLIDVNILYKYSHNNTFNTPTWRTHHNDFFNFIVENTKSTSFLEIGGHSGVLSQKILEYNPSCHYTILDLCHMNPGIKNVSFVSGNCENFNYTSKSTILMSHVFEHLYNPTSFIERIAKGRVPEVFISIPNMEISLQNSSISFIHIEHTFYLTIEMILYMFSNYGYTCKLMKPFKNHSFFFHFTFNDVCKPHEINREKATLYKRQFTNYFERRTVFFEGLLVKNDFYIAPSGHFGQCIYNNLKHFKDRMLGFLDNDPSKIGKRMYGTHLLNYPMTEIQKHKEISVVLHAGPYLSEIKKQLFDYNPLVKFIDITV